MQVNREGIYRATVIDKAVALKGQHKLTAWQVKFALIEELIDGDYKDIASESMEISKDFYLEKKDGSLSDHTINKIREATGWDGRDPFWLEDSLPNDLVVKLTIKWDEPTDPKYKPKLDVAWLDHRDSTGSAGIARATDQEKNAIRSKIGGKLRAIAGGSSVSTPKPAGKPLMPARQAPAPGSTKEEAWAEFIRDIKPTVTDDIKASEWSRILDAMFPGKGDDQMTPADWLRVKNEAPAQFKPF